MKVSFVLVLFLLMAGGLQAQDGGRRGGASSDLSIKEIAANRTKNIDKVVGMTPDQEDSVKVIYADFLKDQKKVREEFDGSSEKMREEMETVRNALNEKVKEILNEEQYQLFEEHSEKRRQRGRNRRQD